MECDVDATSYTKDFTNISIHALTWSATSRSNHPQMLVLFQSTHSHGVRHPSTILCYLSYEFQSTHSHGVRHLLGITNVANTLFQSTHSHGVRLRRTQQHIQLLLFQSTHSHGVRQRSLKSVYSLSYFNPRTHMECDSQVCAYIAQKRDISIHALTWSATWNRLSLI